MVEGSRQSHTLQARMDANDLVLMKCTQPDEVFEVEFEQQHWERYWDDSTSKSFDGDKVRSARAEYIKVVKPTHRGEVSRGG